MQFPIPQRAEPRIDGFAQFNLLYTDYKPLSVEELKDPENYFKGIIHYIISRSDNKQNINEFTMLCPKKDDKFPPRNCVLNDPSVYIASFPQKDNFIGLRFLRIKIKPTAIVLKSQPPNPLYKQLALRTFIIVGRLDDQPPVILKECNYTDELRQKKTEYTGIYYVNAKSYFNKIYVQQISRSFDRTQTFALERLEVHGKIEYSLPQQFYFPGRR